MEKQIWLLFKIFLGYGKVEKLRKFLAKTEEKGFKKGGEKRCNQG